MRGRLDGQVEGETASIANIIQQKKINDQKTIKSKMEK